MKRKNGPSNLVYFRPQNLDYSFQFPIHLVRQIFYQKISCLFCLETCFSHGFERDLQHFAKCPGRSGEFSRTMSAKTVPLFKTSGDLCAAFRSEFYDQQLEVFTRKLNARRELRDQQLIAVKPTECTTVSTELELRDATIFVDHLSPEVVSFTESSIRHKHLLETFGFYRLRPRELDAATVSFERIEKFKVKIETLQTCVPAADEQLYHIEHTHKRTSGSLTVSALHKRGQKVTDNKLTEFVLENDRDYFEFLKAADSAKTAIPYGINLSKCVPSIGYHQFTKLQSDPFNLLSHLEHHSFGISTPSTYVGTTGSTFALHVEDEDCGSTNQLVFGHDKIWFIFPPSEYLKIIKLAQRLYKESGFSCSNPTRHKTIFIPIDVLQANGIVFTRIEQSAGDTIVLAPRAFHFGYNTGSNLAVAVNFLALHPSDGETFRSQTIYCNCGKPNLRFGDDFRNLANFAWVRGGWKSCPAPK